MPHCIPFPSQNATLYTFPKPECHFLYCCVQMFERRGSCC
jgi:hypothetical protein